MSVCLGGAANGMLIYFAPLRRVSLRGCDESDPWVGIFNSVDFVEYISVHLVFDNKSSGML